MRTASPAAIEVIGDERKLRFLLERPVSSGIVYGMIVYGFMNFLVLRLSAFSQRTPPRPPARTIGLLVLVFCIGLPISLIVCRFSKQS